MKRSLFWWERHGRLEAQELNSEDKKKSQKQLQQMREYKAKCTMAFTRLREGIHLWQQALVTKIRYFIMLVIVLMRPITNNPSPA
jgi:hypothetical protein